MTTRNIVFRTTCTVLLWMLVGCNVAQQSPTPTSLDAQAIWTAAAQTADARLKEIPTNTPEPPTPTVSAVPTTLPQTTATLEVSATPQGTLIPSPAPTVSGGVDNAVFVKDVTIPDGWAATPGGTFTKTWQFMNTGTTTWSTSYELVFVSGDVLGGPASVRLPIEVPPNQLVDVSVELVGPQNVGTYKGFWRIRNTAGTFFGDSVYVQISVGGGVAATPGGTQTPGTTQTPSIPVVTNPQINVDNANVTAVCPYKFVFTTSFQVNQTATVTYQLEAGGFTLTLPEARTETLNPNTYTNTYELEITTSGTGWARLHVTAPADILSNQVTFTLTCQ